MAAGPIPTLSAITLTPAEIAAGFTAYPTGTGFDLNFSLSNCILDLKAAAAKLTEILAVLPSGANQVVIAAQLAILVAASIVITALDGGAAASIFTLSPIDGGAAGSTYTNSPISGGTA